jgi:hypothetical protein
MTARIFRPAKTAMQSGKANTQDWVLEFEPEKPRSIDPIMGYTSSGDMKSQIRMHFENARGGRCLRHAQRRCLQGDRT